jgi:hypothetical protein
MNEKPFARIANKILAPARNLHTCANVQVCSCLRVTEANR